MFIDNTLAHSVLNGMLPLSLSPWALGDIVKEERDRKTKMYSDVGQEGHEDSKHTRTDAHLNSKRL